MWSKILALLITELLRPATKWIVEAAPKALVKIRQWWQGKSIAIIGQTASGKDSLFSRLQGQGAPTIHNNTTGLNPVENFEFLWPLPDGSKIEFKCKKSFNVGGEREARDRFWIPACKTADVIFYLIDIDRLINDRNATVERIKSDFVWLAASLPDFKAGCCIHVLVNKVDLLTVGCDPELLQDSINEQIGQYIDRIELMAKKILGSHFSRVTGISPISMLDSHIFTLSFNDVLESVFKARTAQ